MTIFSPDILLSSPGLLIAWVVCFIALAIATMNDLRTREVPDWLNYGLIAFGTSLGLFFSIAAWSPFPFLAALIGFSACAAIGFLMYYAGQWGGGDAKLLMGIGAVIGLPFSGLISTGFSRMPFLFSFLINTLIAGAAYGLVWTSVLAFRKKEFFVPAWKGMMKKRSVGIARVLSAIIALALFAVAFLSSGYGRVAAFSLGVIVYVFFYLWVFVRAIEKGCMEKDVAPETLTEGDWILHDIVIDGKRIAGPKDLGVSKDQITELILLKKRKKVVTVAIKEGVPFVPSFFLAFLLTTIFPSWLAFLR